MPDRSVLPDNPWWPSIRRAFLIPEHVSTSAARDIIARSLMRAIPLPPSEQLGHTAVFSQAAAHVGAMLDSAKEGELDLAICGHGLLIDLPGGGYQEDTALNSAIATMEGRLRMLQKRRAWFEWLWTTLAGYIAEHPYVD